MPLWSCSNCVCAGWYCRVEPVSFPARKSGFRREKYLLQKMQQGSCAFGLAKSKNPFVPFNECRGRPGSGLSGRKVTARPAKHEPARSGVCWENDGRQCRALTLLSRCCWLVLHSLIRNSISPDVRPHTSFRAAAVRGAILENVAVDACSWLPPGPCEGQPQRSGIPDSTWPRAILRDTLSWNASLTTFDRVKQAQTRQSS